MSVIFGWCGSCHQNSSSEWRIPDEIGPEVAKLININPAADRTPFLHRSTEVQSGYRGWCQPKVRWSIKAWPSRTVERRSARDNWKLKRKITSAATCDRKRGLVWWWGDLHVNVRGSKKVVKLDGDYPELLSGCLDSLGPSVSTNFPKSCLSHLSRHSDIEIV